MPHAHDGVVRLLAIADLVPENDLDLLLDAFGRLVTWCPQARLLVVGEGPEGARLAARVEAEGLRPTVGILEAASAPRLIELMQRTDVLVVPHAPGDAPAVPPQLPVAMASGVCVVAHEVGAVGRLLADGVDALLVPPGDLAGLLRTLHLVVDNLVLRAHLGAAAAAGARGALRSA
jgi:glycosyltransferase involved in cell wall biosynthesis